MLEFCDQKWAEADNASSGTWPPPDMLSGEKKAYNAVFQYVRTLIDEA